MTIRKTTTVISVCIVWLLSSCGIFDTRDAEEPEGKVHWNHFPITPYQTLENLRYAYESNDNINRYANILNSAFEFFFDSQDIQDYNLPVSWQKDEEIEMRSLINKDMDLTMQPIEEREDIIQSETAVLYRDYTLSINRSSDTSYFAGSMTIYLQRETDGFWRIYRWEDFRIDNEVTWGRLKYEFTPQ